MDTINKIATNTISNDELEIIVKKVAIKPETARKLKAIGVLFEHKLDNKNESYLMGKGIEKIIENCKGNLNFFEE